MKDRSRTDGSQPPRKAARRSRSPLVRWAWLVTSLLVLTGWPALAADEKTAGSFEALQAEFDRAAQGGDFARALGIAETMNDLVEPQHSEALYAIARMQCLLGRKDSALASLQRAADAGFWDSWRMRADEAFQGIKDDGRFKAIVKAVWARSYIALLERPDRDESQKPDEIMARLAFRPGERVADVGAGSGYFTVRVARAVGTGGVVWAIDISQEMLDYLAARVRQEKLENVQLRKVQKDDPQLPPGGVDTILMVDTLHYIQDKAGYAKKLLAGLAPGGRLVVIDYIPKPMAERPWGPPPEQQMSKESVDRDMAAAGFKLVQSYDFLKEQYFMVYQAAQ